MLGLEFRNGAFNSHTNSLYFFVFAPITKNRKDTVMRPSERSHYRENNECRFDSTVWD